MSGFSNLSVFLDEKILHFFSKIETSNIVKSWPNIGRKVGECDYSYLANFSHRNVVSWISQNLTLPSCYLS